MQNESFSRLSLLTISSFFFWTSLLIALYVYVGYYALLHILAVFSKREIVTDETLCPKVSLIISAYNEEAVIGKKIRNSLGIDYPVGRLEIIVVSDASTDGTDTIVKEYKHPNIILLRQEERMGKTAGLNMAASVATGDVLIFSDANAMYRPDAVRKLVRNFADPQVGYVTGEARYVDNPSMAGDAESIYWNYEITLKTLETRLGSMVGADGAIYALRRQLYAPLRVDDINDFVNPLQVVANGYRGVYEPEAVCYEDAACDFRKEFHRKRRIVNRSWHGLLGQRTILNPFRYGFYSIQVISHKLLRWMMPFILVILLTSNLFLAGQHGFYLLTLLAQLTFFVLAWVGYHLQNRQSRFNRIFSLPMYFCLVNIASAMGILQSLGGKVTTTWETVRR